MTPPLPFVLATRNPDKAREIVEIFVSHYDTPLVALALDDLAFLVDRPEAIAASSAQYHPPDVAPDVEETGDTLDANALIKGRAWAHALGIVAVADDTGLEVDALAGAPGVYSARYAGPEASYADNVARLLRELDGTDAERRAARFATVAVAVRPRGGEVVVRGIVEGTIEREPRGDNGFGYDPVFVPAEGDGRTFAEMAPAEKHAFSHRGRAFRALAAALNDVAGNEGD